MSAPIVELDRVTKRFGGVTAVDAVSLELHPGRTLGVVGESGCGKSTTARLIVGLERPSDGALRFNGTPYGRSARGAPGGPKGDRDDLPGPVRVDRRPVHGRRTSSPSRSTSTALARAGRAERIRELLDSVGMGGIDPDAYPAQFSGGQRQRIGIARALALDPELVVCDEPTSALDVSVQAQILNLLLELQRERGVGLLVISHDLHVVRRMSDEVAVMYAGMVVEQGPAEAGHPLAAAPVHARAARRDPGDVARRAAPQRPSARRRGDRVGGGRRLPVLDPLPARDRHLPGREAGPRGRRARGRLPSRRRGGLTV